MFSTAREADRVLQKYLQVKVIRTLVLRKGQWLDVEALRSLKFLERHLTNSRLPISTFTQTNIDYPRIVYLVLG